MRNIAAADSKDRDLVNPRLLVDVVTEAARHTPNKVWGSLPKSATDASEGYYDIPFYRLAYAVDRAARWLQSTLGDGDGTFEPLAYMGPPDSRYIIFTLASIKTGYQMLYLSTRNSDEAQYHVMNQVKCCKFLCGGEAMRKRVDILIRNWPGDGKSQRNDEAGLQNLHSSRSDILVLTVPEQDGLLKDEPEPPFPYSKTIEEARREPLLILHTSSTTGMPKAIPLNQGYGFHEDIMQQIPEAGNYDIITRKPFYGYCRMFVAMPLFHGGGVLLTLLKSLYHDLVAVFQPPAVPLSAAVFDGILRYGKCTGCVVPPSLLEEMLAVPSYFDTLANLSFVQFGSGPLSKAAGDTLLTRQKNCPHFIGSSEIGLPPLLELDDPVTEWQYFHFHPWSGVDMRPVDGDEKLCEMFVTRIDKRAPGLQPVFELFPDLDEWPMHDLYAQHPTKPYLWKCVGRADDVMVLSNGEKLNPIEMEGLIANTVPEVVGALVVGQGRFNPGLLLEVRGVDTTDPSERKRLIEAIWPSVQKANLEAPKHGQLTKSLIIFTTPDKPFARTPKLSVRRGPTIQLYTQEIDQMYAELERNPEAANDVDLPENINLESFDLVCDLVAYLVTALTGWSDKPGLEDDLFMLGMDSLHVVRMTRTIKVALSRQPKFDKLDKVTSRMVYNNPTIQCLAQSIFSLLNSKAENGVESSREIQMEDMITKYTEFKFDTLNSHPNGVSSAPQRWRVILTGSTGSLGTYLLWTLLCNPLVSAVYCLNRSSNARARQLDALDAQGLRIPLNDLEERVHFLTTESLAGSYLGLGNADIYNNLLKACPTHILHNAWPVNFNLSLASFESHVAGVRALVDFCAKVGPAKPTFFYVSSLSSVTALSLNSTVPEHVVSDASVPSKMGYGESKYVAERVLNAATIASGGAIPTAILRVGQIAGPVGWKAKVSSTNKNAIGDKSGIWPIREWLPSLVISSKSIGALPTTLGRMEDISWIPVDMLADIICEIMDPANSKSEPIDEGAAINGSNNHGSKVYNLLNPNFSSWEKALLETTRNQLGIETAVPLSQWVELVNNGPDETETLAPNPAKKILPFYTALAAPASLSGDQQDGESSKNYRMERAMSISKVFRELQPVREEWMTNWIAQWGLAKK